MTNIPRVRDLATGVLLESLSTSAGRIPAVARRFGAVDSIKGAPVFWRLVAQSASDLTLVNRWVRHEDEGSSGLVPAQYIPPINHKEVAVMTFDKRAVDRFTDTNPRLRHAVAYVLGESAVMVGTSSSIDVFGTDPADAGRYAVGMRVGEGLFQGQPVLLKPHRKTAGIYAADMAVSFMPLPEVDPRIPVV